MAMERDYTYLGLGTCQSQLTTWLAADNALATGAQSYTLGNRSLTRADAREIAQRVEDYSIAVARLNGQASTVSAAVLGDGRYGNGYGWFRGQFGN